MTFLTSLIRPVNKCIYMSMFIRNEDLRSSVFSPSCISFDDPPFEVNRRPVRPTTPTNYQKGFLPTEPPHPIGFYTKKVTYGWEFPRNMI